MPIRINANTVIEDHELHETFVRSPGPGGQKVNKTASAVQLRFDITSLPADVRERLRVLAGSRVSSRGELVIFAHRHRSRETNRQDARHRLADLVRRALVAPKKRRKTKPSRAARERRMAEKRRRGERKRLRRKPAGE